MMPKSVLKWVPLVSMTAAEKKANPKALVTGGYLKRLDEYEVAQYWWNRLSEKKKKIIMALPNFDAKIFYECTGIKVEPEVTIDEDGIKRWRDSH